MTDETNNAPVKGYQLLLDGEPIELGTVLGRIENDLAHLSERVDGIEDTALPDDGRVTHVPTAWPADAETRGLTGRDLWEVCLLYQNEGAVLPLAAEWDKQSSETIDRWDRLAVFATSRVANAIAAEPDAAGHGDASADAAWVLLDQAYGRSKEQRKLIARQQETIESLRAERNAALADAAKAKASKPITDGDLTAQLNEAHRQVRVLTADSERYKAERDKVQRTVADRDSEIAALKELRQRRENELAEVKAEHERELEAAMGRTSQIEKERNAAWSERDAARRKLGASQIKCDDLQREKRTVETHMAKVVAERDKARDQLADANAEHERRLQSLEMQRDEALAAEAAERTVKESAWTETKELRERLNKIAAQVAETANLAEVPPF